VVPEEKGGTEVNVAVKVIEVSAVMKDTKETVDTEVILVLQELLAWQEPPELPERLDLQGQWEP
jgi:hypothetical protein